MDLYPKAKGPKTILDLSTISTADVCEAGGLEGFRPYDLRHSMATLMLADGVHPKIISERLGHASIVLTLDTYSHVLPNMQKDATARLGAVLYG